MGLVGGDEAGTLYLRLNHPDRLDAGIATVRRTDMAFDDVFCAVGSFNAANDLVVQRVPTNCFRKNLPLFPTKPETAESQKFASILRVHGVQEIVPDFRFGRINIRRMRQLVHRLTSSRSQVRMAWKGCENSTS